MSSLRAAERHCTQLTVVMTNTSLDLTIQGGSSFPTCPLPPAEALQWTAVDFQVFE